MHATVSGEAPEPLNAAKAMQLHHSAESSLFDQQQSMYQTQGSWEVQDI